MSDRTCSVEGCDRPTYAKGFCRTHYHTQHRRLYRAEIRAGIRIPNRVIQSKVECERCGQSFAYKRRTNVRLVCQPCREVDWAWRYGLTSVTLLEFYAAHDNRCDICGANQAPNRWGKGLHIDHDHQTGDLRGLLCSPCNRGLGYFADDPARLRAAAAYLDR